MNIPYTYLIGWKKHNIWYYGVRYSKNCNPSDLWVTYFTSSNHVKKFRQQHGEPDIIQIRKTFVDIIRAKDWEEKVIKKMNCVISEKWLNRGNAGRKFYNISKPTNSFTKGNISWNKGKKGVQVAWNKGKSQVQIFDKERNEKLSNSLKRKYKIIKPNGDIEIILGLKDYCEKNKWNYSTVCNKAKSEKSNIYKNYKIIRIDNRPSGHTK
jgi:hypothetical protein